MQHRKVTWLRRRSCWSHCSRKWSIRREHARSRNSFRKVPNFFRCSLRSIVSQWLRLWLRLFLPTFLGRHLFYSLTVPISKLQKSVNLPQHIFLSFMAVCIVFCYTFSFNAWTLENGP